MSKRYTGTWAPNRDPYTPASRGWRRFLDRCKISYEAAPDDSTILLIAGQNGWAFSTALRFQTSAAELTKTEEDFYWSSYSLLQELIERTRRPKDITVLEAVEALAVIHLCGKISSADVIRQLKQIGVWP